MSRDQRSRLALVVLLAVFLIPVGMSSLRGLTHVLTCTGETASTFTLISAQGQEPTLLSATVIERGDAALLCGGLSLDMAAGAAGPGRAVLTVPITNHSDVPWNGSVRLELGGTSIPVAIGRIAPGATVEDQVTVRLSDGAQELSGALLIGP
jgi:hypothetical protein